jgi:hypothetical protein
MNLVTLDLAHTINADRLRRAEATRLHRQLRRHRLASNSDHAAPARRRRRWTPGLAPSRG